MSLKAQPKEERNQPKSAQQSDPFAGQASPDSFGGGQAQEEEISFN